MKDLLVVNIFSKNESVYNGYYLQEIEKNHMSYDVIYFERYKMDETAGENEFLFKEYCPTGGNNFKKIGTMLRLAHYIRKKLREGQYKGVIVFTSVPAIMIYDVLLSKYKNRYLLDIRDYTHESNRAYFALEKKLVEHSFATVISSRGFLRFLPESDKYILTHNIMPDNMVSAHKNIREKSKISLGYVGSIRYYDANCDMIRQFGNDPLVQLDYYGTVTQNCDLKGYAKEHGISNVHFHGRYRNEEKRKIYESIDVINSVYGTESLETTTLTPNRLYDGVLYNCPVIVSKGTYLEELVNKYQLGFAADAKTDDIPQMLREYLKDFDEEEFRKHCREFLEEVEKDMQKQQETLQAYLNQIKEDTK